MIDTKKEQERDELHRAIWAIADELRAMAAFGCTTDNLTLYLKNIFADGELEEKSTTEEISVIQKEGNRNVSRNPKP